ncbi:MAG TPA: hypothetical protein VGH00_09010 [Chthoniobacterales bacterium]
MIHVERIALVSSILAGAGLFLTPRRFLRNGWDRIRAVGRWLSEDKARHRRTAFTLIWIIALIPMLHLANLVRQYAVEVPTLDDWEMAPLIVNAHDGHLRWADIFAQQQEARTVLPKLIFILSAANGHWDVRDEMMLSVICCGLTAAGIFVLLRRSGLGVAALAICFWLDVITIFSPAKFELWIFASGFPSFLPALFIVAGLVVIGTNITTGWKFALCGLFAFASSFSLPHGLLSWGLTFPVLFLVRPVQRWRTWLFSWMLLCAICAAAYFWGYQKPAYLPTFAPAPSGRYVRFLLEFLGGALAYASKTRPGLSAELFGSAQCLLFFLVLGYTARRIRDRDFLAKAAPWFAVALYSLGSAFLAALGRVGYGAHYALASRYVTFSIYLLIALIALLAIIVRRVPDRSPAPSRAWSYAICGVLIFGYLAPYKVCAFNTTFFMRALSAKDRLARAAVFLNPVVDTAEVIKKTAYPGDARPVIEASNDLDRLKLLRPSLIRTNRLALLPHEDSDGVHATGTCETIVPTDGQSVRATGWAVLNSKGRPPDAVAVAYQATPEQEWLLCAISDSFEMRPEIVKRFDAINQLWSGWSATFPRKAFPADAKLSFWAIDLDQPKLYRLKDTAATSPR